MNREGSQPESNKLNQHRMSEPEFSDQQKQPDSFRPNELSRPTKPSYRSPDSYRPDDSKRNENLASSVVSQYQPTSQDPATQMLSELTHLLKSFKEVMVQAKHFFGKYLTQDENHFKSPNNEQSTSHVYRQQPQQNPQPKREQYYDQQNQYDQYQQHQRQDRYQKFEQPHDPQPYVREQQPKKNKWGFGKKAKPQDPNKPKAPLTPYFLFFSETRDMLRQKYPEKSLSEIGSLGGSVWRQLSEAERQSYKDRYEQAKKGHKVLMQDYNSSGGVYSGRMMDFESTTHADDF